MSVKISIIIPVYNVAQYLFRCANSVLSQTYNNLEVIFVDDGSTDGSEKICDDLKCADERIIVIHQKNGGLSQARNTGIDICTGEYIAFIDSDDYIAPNMIKLLLNTILQSNAELAICNFVYVNADGTEIKSKNQEMPVKNEVLDSIQALRCLCKEKYYYYVIACNKLYHRSVFKTLRFVKGKIHEDEFIAHRVLGECKTIVCISDILYFYVQRDNSIMNDHYTLKRLDAVEALFERCIFFIEKGMRKEALFSLTTARQHLAFGMTQLKKDSTAKVQIKKLVKSYRKFFMRLLKENFSYKRQNAENFIFNVSPFLYLHLRNFIKLF